MLTYSQIEETRLSPDGKHSLSLRQAAHGVGLPFEQCPECQGSGYTRAILLLSMSEIAVLAEKFPDNPVPVQYDRCERLPRGRRMACRPGGCAGAGGWLSSGRAVPRPTSPPGTARVGEAVPAA